jgi:hypothetical protein
MLVRREMVLDARFYVAPGSRVFVFFLHPVDLREGTVGSQSEGSLRNELIDKLMKT